MKTLSLSLISASAFLVAAPFAVEAGSRGCGPDSGFARMSGFDPMGMGSDPQEMFKDFDADKDGKLTRAEIDKVLGENFRTANKDGQDGVTIQEFEPWFWQQHRQSMVRAYQFLDQDGDSKVTEAEVGRLADRMMERMDRNNDGGISDDDRGGRMGEGRGRGHGMRHGWGGWRQGDQDCGLGGPMMQRGQDGERP